MTPQRASLHIDTTKHFVITDLQSDTDTDATPSKPAACNAQERSVIGEVNSRQSSTRRPESETHLSCPKDSRTPPRSGASSIIKDSGDAKHLDNTADSSRYHNSRDHSPHAAIGTQYDAAEASPSLSKAGTSDVAPGSNYSSLDDALRDAKLESIEKDNCFFIPLDQLDRIITLDSIISELGRLQIGREHERVALATKIWKIPRNATITTRRKLFSVLVLLDKVDTIIDFIDEDIYDNNLPFDFTKDKSTVYDKDGAAVKAFQDLEKWRKTEKDNFERYQWWMRSPYFELSCREAPKVSRYRVEDRAVLPFIDLSPSEQPPWNEGGYSVVRKVKIHTAHYNHKDFSNPVGDNTYFAVKTLRFRAVDEDFTREVKSLIRLNNENHNHLIRLLATFQHKKQLHLIFPWADGNLQDFWKTVYPDPRTPVRNQSLATWMAGQCLGLARGLQMIHHNPINKSTVQLHDMQPDALHKRHGQHQDLKPENILWFTERTSKTVVSMGVLRISDFGFADFHGSNSMSAIPISDLGMTGTYRAPEWDVMERVSSAYDLWCIGCVLLEFVVWYLCGWQGVDDFLQKRLRDSQHYISSRYKEDAFFNAVRMDHVERMAQAKTAVRDELYALRQHENCSEMMLDLLDLIEYKLLRMDPEKRIGCGKLIEVLQTIYDQCLNAPKYTTEQIKHRCGKRSTDLSVLAQSPSQSHKGNYSNLEQRSRTVTPIITETTHIAPTANSPGIEDIQLPRIYIKPTPPPSGTTFRQHNSSTEPVLSPDLLTAKYIQSDPSDDPTSLDDQQNPARGNTSRGLVWLKKSKKALHLLFACWRPERKP